MCYLLLTLSIIYTSWKIIYRVYNKAFESLCVHVYVHVTTGQMAENEETGEFAVYVDWTSPWSNSSSSDDRVTLSSVGDAAICVVAAVLSVVTAGGNLLVVVSYQMDRHLQTVSNYFLLSLSVADFTIGAISMPLYTTYLVLGYWPLGPVFCDIWLSLDYTMSNASVANLLVISFDRYMSVTRPLTYRVRRTRRRAAAMIAGAWVASALLWTPWIVAWPYVEGKRTVPVDDYSKDIPYAIGHVRLQ